MEGKIKVGVIFGGPSGEFDVSRMSADAIVHALDQARYDIIPLGVGKDGRWFGPIPADDVRTFDPAHYLDRELMLVPKPGRQMISLSGHEVPQVDVMLPIIHGTFGEDGKLQALLEICGFPYVGAGIAGSAVGMDKVLMRKIVAYHEIPQVTFLAINRSAWQAQPEDVLSAITTALDYPIFVKPANAGSSVGITKATDRLSLIQALDTAAAYDRKVIVEQGVDVREIEISVLGNDSPLVSEAGEVIASNEFYDYNAKYIDNKSRTEIPADITPADRERLLEMSKVIYQALDLSGFSRMDFFIEKGSGRLLFNEVNTLPGFTNISMYAKLWAHSGLAMTALLDRMIGLALDRYEDLQQNRIDL